MDNSCWYAQIWPECVILCPGCSSIPGLQLHPEHHVSSLCQLMDLFISKPELLIVVTKPILVISPIPVKVLPGFSIITPPLNDNALKWHIMSKSRYNMNVDLFAPPPLHISPQTLGRGCHKPWSWSSQCCYLNLVAARSPSQTRSQPWESWVWNTNQDIVIYPSSDDSGLYHQANITWLWLTFLCHRPNREEWLELFCFPHHIWMLGHQRSCTHILWQPQGNQGHLCKNTHP